jgi:rubrerythrin
MESCICSNCKYKFKAREMPKFCPYCDKDRVEKEESAEELLAKIE